MPGVEKNLGIFISSHFFSYMFFFTTTSRIYIFFVVIFTTSLFAQQYPISAESPRILPAGTAHAEFGIAHFRNQSFPLSGLDGNLTKLGILRFGFSYDGFMEVQFDGTVLDLLEIRNRSAAFNSAITSLRTTVGDVGDFTLWTKLLFLNEYNSMLGLSLRFGVELPNAGNESGLGVDEFNFFSSLLIQKHIAGMEWTLNAGLGILGDPTEYSEQHDVLVYALKNKTVMSEQTFLVMETAGRTGHRGNGIERLANGKLGIEMLHNNFDILLNGVLNFSPVDNAIGAELSVGYNFEIIHAEKK